MLRPFLRAGDTYTIDLDITRDAARAYWTGADRGVWIAWADGQILGSYCRKTNQQGGGSHLCNYGFVTADAARAKGIDPAMLDHVLSSARRAGFYATHSTSFSPTTPAP